jgi:DNA-binding transcriptional regulator GbsR (MarR family)
MKKDTGTRLTRKGLVLDVISFQDLAARSFADMTGDERANFVAERDFTKKKEWFLRNKMVRYARHQLSNYDDLVNAASMQPDTSRKVRALTRTVNRLIGQAWPELKETARWQIAQKRRKQGW